MVLQQLLRCWAGVHGIDPQQGMNCLLCIIAEAQSVNGKSSRAAAAKIAVNLVTLTVNILDVSRGICKRSTDDRGREGTPKS